MVSVQDNRTDVADTWAMEMAAMVSADDLSVELRAHIKPDVDMSDNSFMHLRQPMRDLVVVCDSPCVR